LKGNLYGTGQPISPSFLIFRKETKRFFCSNPKQRNLWETAKSPETAKSSETAKSQFESDSNRKISLSLSQKEAHIGCPDPQRLPFKGSSLLQNLIEPGYLELPF